MVRTADVEANVPVRTDATQEESNTACLPNARFVFLHRLIRRRNNRGLQTFGVIQRCAIPQGHVHHAIREDLAQIPTCRRAERPGIHQQRLVRVQPERPQVELPDVVRKAVLLRRI